MTATLPAFLTPELIAIIILGLFACIELVIIVMVGNILRTYAKMLVMKTRIMADGTVTLADADLIPFVVATINLMTQLEALLHYITGYILNHPSTGWIRGYSDQIGAVTEAVVQQLAAEEPVPIPEQPAQVVSPEGETANV